MARPISFQAAPRDPREELRARLERAPQEHAEAVLAAYEVIQGLHDQGLLDILRAALAARDETLEKLVGNVNTPEGIRAIRNLLSFRRILGTLEPEWVQALVLAIPTGLARAKAERDQPVRPWQLLRRAFSQDSLRGVAALVSILESFGRNARAPRGHSDLDGQTR